MPARPSIGPQPSCASPELRLTARDGDHGPALRADQDRPLGHVPAPATVADQLSFESGVPNVARIYDALLGGKDNYAVDREAALALTAAVPGAARAARDNRAFLGRAVRYLAAEAGISQFLDIGTGLPTRGNVHEVARQVNPDARVVYCDSDPVVVSHGRAILADQPGVTATDGDLCYPRELLTRREVKQVIDFTRPVGVLLVAVLHFLDDSQAPYQAVRAIIDRLAPGSHVVISHGTGDQLPADAVRRAEGVYHAARVPGTARSYPAVLRFFDGTELVRPGLADVAAWRSGRALPSRPTLAWAGIGRKPGP